MSKGKQPRPTAKVPKPVSYTHLDVYKRQVLLFPLFWGVDGIWLSIVAAEMMAVAVAAGLLALKRKKYCY